MTYEFAGKTYTIIQSKDWFVYLGRVEIMLIDRSFTLAQVKKIIREEA